MISFNNERCADIWWVYLEEAVNKSGHPRTPWTPLETANTGLNCQIKYRSFGQGLGKHEPMIWYRHTLTAKQSVTALMIANVVSIA